MRFLLTLSIEGEIDADDLIKAGEKARVIYKLFTAPGVRLTGFDLNLVEWGESTFGELDDEEVRRVFESSPIIPE